MNKDFKWAGEEGCKKYGYPVGYEKPNTLEEQYKVLLKHFPVLQGKMYNLEFENKVLHEKAEGNFLYFDWRIIDSTYCGALQKFLVEYRKSLNDDLINHYSREFDSSDLRQIERTAKFLDTIKEQQKDYEILVIPAQFGYLHKGYLANKERASFADNEFCLGPFEVGLMLLTHPGRLVHNSNLRIVCQGGETSLFRGWKWENSPIFYYQGGLVSFGGIPNWDIWWNIGSATAFTPKE